MAVVKWIRKKSRLAAMVGKPGGITIGKALEHAELNLADIRAEAIERIDGCIAALEQKAEQGDVQAEWLDEVYELSSAVLKSVGPYGYERICRAAFSLCELADRLRAQPRTIIEPVRVHTRALRLLFSNPDLPAEAQEEVLEGLDQVLKKVPAPAGIFERKQSCRDWSHFAS